MLPHPPLTCTPIADDAVTPLVHQALQANDLLPASHLLASHLVDTGYLDAELLVSSQQQYGVDLLGPARPDVNRM